MGPWLLRWAACLVLSRASGVLGFALSTSIDQGIVLPMLLDFQPVVLPLDPTADVQEQLEQFCVTHSLDSERCPVLQDAVSSIVRLEKGGGSQQPCRPKETPQRPSFALVKNLLVALDSSPLQPSFQWLEDASDNIASDICGFLARSHAAVDVSVADDCTSSLAQAISRSFEWINALPVCEVHGLRETDTSLISRVAGSEKIRVAVVKGPLAVDHITLTPWELRDFEEETLRSEDAAVDEVEEEARATDPRIRIAPIINSIDETEAIVTGTAAQTSTHPGAFMAEALVAMVCFTVVIMVTWLRLLLDRQVKSPTDSDQSARGIQVLPLESSNSARADTVKAPHSDERFVDGLAIIHRVNDRMLTRIAWLRWRATVEAPVSLSVETNPSLMEPHGQLKLIAFQEDEEPPTPSRTPRSSSTHRRVPSFSLAAMSFLMIPCSPMASSSPRRGRACPDTPLARVTRLLEAESATDELLDQFDAARLDTERQSRAAGRIQRMWRSSRACSPSGKGDAAKRSHLPRGALHLLGRVRRHPNPPKDLFGQSASSA